MPPSLSKVAGALLGCAVGDAMGAPFEGLWAESIPSAPSLLAGYHEYVGYPRGQYTDDTQLTLATVESIVESGDVDVRDIARRIAELWRHRSVIGPGGACTEAAERFLATGDHTHMGAPSGQAGNGTAMRTAILGLWYWDAGEDFLPSVAEVSRITHQDARSVAGGLAVAAAAQILSTRGAIDPEGLCSELAQACRSTCSELADLLVELAAQRESGSVRQFIAEAGKRTPEFDRPIITPFVIPTVLASVYCLITHPTSWADAVTTAIGLGGDTDTLGAIVGAVAGARDGVEAIPVKLLVSLHNADQIQGLAAQYHSRLCANWVRRAEETPPEQR